MSDHSRRQARLERARQVRIGEVAEAEVQRAAGTKSELPVCS